MILSQVILLTYLGRTRVALTLITDMIWHCSALGEKIRQMIFIMVTKHSVNNVITMCVLCYIVVKLRRKEDQLESEFCVKITK